jgi:hypothetical protein
MQIDTEHLHYWMQAIRQSEDPMRTMDAFWSGQLKSKEWLIKNLRNNINKFVSIDIHGGWVGVLASMLFQSDIPIRDICSVDIDPSCESIASMMNKKEEMVGKFRAVTADMCSIHSNADIIINTSCEHITQHQYDQWLSNQSDTALFVIQSNNYFELEEHIRCSIDLDDFVRMSSIKPYWRGEFKTLNYTRYMIIGRKKNV